MNKKRRLRLVQASFLLVSSGVGKSKFGNFTPITAPALHRTAASTIEVNFELLVQQAYDRQLETEQLRVGWE